MSLWLGQSAEDLTFNKRSERKLIFHAKYFQGDYNSTELKSLFEEMKELNIKTKLPVSIINLGSDLHARQLFQWVGIFTSADTTAAYKELQRVEIEAEGFISTHIDVHNAVMPKPEEVREAALNYALELGMTLDYRSIEIYYSDTDLEIVFPLLKSTGTKP